MKIKFRKLEEQKDHDIYTEQGICQKAEEDAISGYEEAFMAGYCSRCD